MAAAVEAARGAAVDDRQGWARLFGEATSERAAQPRHICDLCVQLLGVTGAGISAVTEIGNRGLVYSTDDVSGRIEELQVTLGEGPCIDATRSGAPVMVADLDSEVDLAVERWPAFLEAASGAGVRAVFAMPLRVGAIGIGALDLYRTRPGPLDDDQLAGALLAADAATLALLDVEAAAARPAGVDGATPVADLTHQPQVHQATGMLKVQVGGSIEDAFLLLRAHAFASGRSLLDVAGDVVGRRLRFSPEEP